PELAVLSVHHESAAAGAAVRPRSGPDFETGRVLRAQAGADYRSIPVPPITDRPRSPRAHSRCTSRREAPLGSIYSRPAPRATDADTAWPPRTRKQARN